MELSLDELQQDVIFYRSQCWSVNTNRTYRTHRKLYLLFCHKAGLQPVPASTNQLCLYAAFLARRLKYNSLKQYMNIIRILHLEWGLPNPMTDNFILSSTLRGIRRHMGDSTQRKAPMTPTLLFNLLNYLDITTSQGANTWAAALVMFYGLLRISNVLPASIRKFNPKLHLRRRDITFTATGVLITIRWSKTNQFRTRVFNLPLPRLQGHKLCPAQAIFHAFRLSAGAPLEGPPFVTRLGDSFQPLTTASFIQQVKSALGQICDPKDYAGHSFRRGGACWAYANGVSVDLIRQLGDWKSNSYTRYILCDQPMVSQALTLMTNSLPMTDRPTNVTN